MSRPASTENNNRKSRNYLLDETNLIIAIKMFYEETGLDISKGKMIEMLCKQYVESKNLTNFTK